MENIRFIQSSLPWEVAGERGDPTAQWSGNKIHRCESRDLVVVQAEALPVWLTLSHSPIKKEVSSCLWLPEGVVVKIKGNTSFNSKPISRVINFPLALPVSVLLFSHYIQPLHLKEDSWGPNFLLSKWFSFVLSYSSYSWLFSLSLFEIWSLPCVGPVYPFSWRDHMLL